MASEDTTSGRDRLSTLPGELIERIFELAYKDEHTTTGAISRKLLPYDRVERFKRVEVPVGTTALLNLLHVLDANPSLRRLVQECHLPYEFDQPPPLKRAARLAGCLLVALPNLRCLTVAGTAGAAVLSPEVCERLGSLRALTVRVPEGGTALCNPGDLRYLLHLPVAPSLTLDLSDVRFWLRDDVFHPQLASASPLPAITDLTILSKNMIGDAAANFIHAFPDLQTLTISSQSIEPSVEELLPVLPPRLPSLTLDTVTCFDGFSEPCDHFLPHYTALTHLSLGEAIFDHLTLFDNLRSLPLLSSLTFRHGAVVDTAELLELISGETRHAPLRTLTLDMVSRGRRGYRLKGEGAGRLHPEHKAALYHVGPDWIVPDFAKAGPHLKPAAVEDLVRVGAKNGVDVRGTAVDAVPVWRDWQQEALNCCLLHGRESGDFTALWEMLGPEEAAAFIGHEFGGKARVEAERS